MKKTYQAPETEVTELFTKGIIMEYGSEPEAGGWVGTNHASFDETESDTPDMNGNHSNLWDD